MPPPDRPAGARAPVVLCAPDKLRGAVDAAGAARALAAGVRDAGGRAVELPVADGGEGTLAAFVAGGHARPLVVRARDAHRRWIDARIGVLGATGPAAGGDPAPALRGVDGSAGGPGAPTDAAVGTRARPADPRARDRHGPPDPIADARDRPTILVEAAEAIALGTIPAAARDVGRASSAGVGDLVRAALELTPARILVTVGGSASIDGGAGFLAALGVDAPADGAALLAEPTAVDPALPGLDPRLASVTIELLHDVDAPLCGPRGAARVFGPQKGASPAEVDAYDDALGRWAAALSADPDAPGSGAAGGLGLALLAIGATPRPGAEAVLDLVDFDALAGAADLVLTAEGSVDASTLQGKTVDAVVRRATALGVPVAVVGGRVEPDAADALRARGARTVEALGPADRPLDVALASAAEDLRAAGARATAAFQETTSGG